ncbi:hypothetical protein ACPB9E_36400 [Streptomyces exfoliatus]|uniref:hypothetical protein n=1 Tax=Streptomyces exfoliatus TaxID=1905 RepID=UPI003C2C4164
MEAHLIESGLITYAAPVSGEPVIRLARVWQTDGKRVVVVTDPHSGPGRPVVSALEEVRAKVASPDGGPTFLVVHHPADVIGDDRYLAYPSDDPEDFRIISVEEMQEVTGGTLDATAPVGTADRQEYRDMLRGTPFATFVPAGPVEPVVPTTFDPRWARYRSNVVHELDDLVARSFGD